MKRVIRWVILIIILLLFAYIAKVRINQKNLSKKQKITTPRLNIVKLAVVQRGTLVNSIKVITAAKGIREVNIFSDVPGKFIKYLVREGDYVKKNQVICLVERDIKGVEYKPVRVTSPISGFVAALLTDRGAVVTPQKPVAFVSNYERIELLLHIPAIYVDEIRNRQECNIRFDGIANVYTGKLSNVSQIIDRRSNTFTASVYLNNKDKKIKSGQLAKVYIIKNKYVNEPLIDRDAVVDQDYIFIYRAGIVHKVKVNIVYGSDKYFAVSGVNQGMKYVIFGQNLLKNGEKVESVSEAGGK